MKQILRAHTPNILATLCVVALLFMIGGQQHASAQCDNGCETVWSLPGTLYVHTEEGCLYEVQYKVRKCVGVGVNRCEIFFDKIASVESSCCYDDDWPDLADLVKSIARTLYINFPNFGCDPASSSHVVQFPSCWKIVTANHLAEACSADPCCTLTGISGSTNYIVTPSPAPDCEALGGVGCRYICN